MATSFTYTTLKAAVKNMLEEQGDDFSSYLDSIIQLAEDKVLRDLNLELFDVSATSSLVNSNIWVAKPADMVGLRSMHYTNTDGDMVLLEQRSWEFCRDYWPNASDKTLTPKYFAEYSETSWAIVGTPQIDMPVTIRYMKRPDGLSVGTASTWLSTHVGDVLFFACLVVSEQYLKADARTSMWKQDYAERLGAALRELRFDRRTDYMPMTATPKKE